MERSHLQPLVATWDLEVAKHRVLAQEEVQHHLESAHYLSELEYKYWLSLYMDQGLPNLTEDLLFYSDHLPHMAHETDPEVIELSVMIDHTREYGLNVDSFDWKDESSIAEDAVSSGKVPELSCDVATMEWGSRVLIVALPSPHFFGMYVVISCVNLNFTDSFIHSLLHTMSPMLSIPPVHV